MSVLTPVQHTLVNELLRYLEEAPIPGFDEEGHALQPNQLTLKDVVLDKLGETQLPDEAFQLLVSQLTDALQKLKTGRDLVAEAEVAFLTLLGHLHPEHGTPEAEPQPEPEAEPQPEPEAEPQPEPEAEPQPEEGQGQPEPETEAPDQRQGE
jgi:outer membrane biosynthesis protein TonB